MRKLINTAATLATSLSLAGGSLAGVAGASGSISNTGPDSYNRVSYYANSKQFVKNDNNVGVNNDTKQYAASGRVEVEHNTTAGNASSGNASNNNSFNTNVSVSNTAGSTSGVWSSGGGSGNNSINTTGPNSYNKVSTKVSSLSVVHNNNNVNVNNETWQTAKSGSVEVSGNTTGGSATSGNASNANSSSTSVSVTNK